MNIKKYAPLLIASIFSLSSCAVKPMKPIVVSQIKPQVEKVEVQAKKTTTSAQSTSTAAEETKTLAEKVEIKYSSDSDVKNVVDSANKAVEESKETILASQETENQLAALQNKAEDQDNELKQSASDIDTLNTQVSKDKSTIVKQDTQIKSLKDTIWKYRAYLLAAGIALLALAALILKPWLWFA